MSARFVSQSIRVPNLSNARSRDAAASVIEEMEIDAKEQQAAEALCELSCSPPISLLFQPSLTGKVVVSPGSSLGYSSYPEVHGHLNHNYSDRINMSLHEPSSIDEGIEIDNERSGYIKHLKSSTEIFQCTWPGCDWSTKSSSEIERHIHQEHQCGSDSEEELFYYTSKRVAVDDVTRAFTQLHASSPPQKKGTSAKAVADHDYLLKAIHSSAPQTIPRRPLHAPAHNSYQADGGSSHSPASVSPLSRSWQSSQVNATSPTSMLSASPGHKRSRSEVKKCRKVYGMERRDEWCTQCKWKKACTRFID